MLIGNGFSMNSMKLSLFQLILEFKVSINKVFTYSSKCFKWNLTISIAITHSKNNMNLKWSEIQLFTFLKSFSAVLDSNDSRVIGILLSELFSDIHFNIIHFVFHHFTNSYFISYVKQHVWEIIVLDNITFLKSN